MLLRLSLAIFHILLGLTTKAVAHPSILEREDLYDAPSQAIQSEICFENVLDHENMYRSMLGQEQMPQQPSSFINGNREHDQQGKQRHKQG